MMWKTKPKIRELKHSDPIRKDMIQLQLLKKNKSRII